MYCGLIVWCVFLSSHGPILRTKQWVVSFLLLQWTWRVALYCHSMVFGASGYPRRHRKFPNPMTQASEVTMYSLLLLVRVGIIATPFHWVRKRCHHEWNDLFSLISLSHQWTDLQRLIIRLIKDLPGFTTVFAWCSWPIRDSKSLFLHHRLGDHSCNEQLEPLYFFFWEVQLHLQCVKCDA